MPHQDFEITGTGTYDLGVAVTSITDIIGYVTAFPSDVNVIDEVDPKMISRFGFITIGGQNGFSGTDQFYWQAPMWIPCERWVWDFAGGNATAQRWVRWYVRNGGVAQVRVYY